MKTLKLGRNRPVAVGPHFRLKNYLRASLPPPPPSVDYSGPAASALVDPLGNDSLGDCVIAAGYHMVEVETANAGGLWVPSSTQIVQDYSAIGGYVPGDASTDNGCDEVTALNYWQDHGFANGVKLLGWLSVDATNMVEVKSAIELFENSFLTFEVPDAWINPFPSADGFVWDVGTPNPNQGHAVCAVGYDASGVQIDSWGLRGTVTWAAVSSLCNPNVGGGLYVVLTPDQLARGTTKAPNGFPWVELVGDFDVMGGTVPIPVGPSGVTLANAQAWAKAGIETDPHHIMTKSTAIGYARAGLAVNWPKS